MTEDMLGKMGGRRSRRPVIRNAPELAKLLELDNRTDQIGWHRGVETEIEEIVQKELPMIEVDESLLVHYLDATDGEYPDIISGAILAAIHDRNGDKPTELHYNARGKEFKGLFTRSRFDTLVLENVILTGMALVGDKSEYRAMAAIGCKGGYLSPGGTILTRDCQDTRVTVTENLINSQSNIIWASIPKSLEEKEIILDGGSARLISYDEKRGIPHKLPEMYINGDLHTVDEAKTMILKGKGKKIVLLGRAFGQYGEMEDFTITDRYQCEVSRSKEEFRAKYEQRKLYLMDELGSDCGSERKFEIVREIMETYR